MKITFRDTANTLCEVETEAGTTFLDAALSAGVKGILGDCGGELSCGTCHVYVEEQFFKLLPPPSEDERIMIDDGVLDPMPNSRLCCQLVMHDGLDGVSVTVAQNG